VTVQSLSQDDNNTSRPPKRVLIIYFSLSGQSRGLVNLLAAGMRKGGVAVTIERVVTEKRLRFPFGTVIHTLWMMLITFLRARVAIREPSPACFEPYDLIVLSGPTWSYNPSGPILSLLDHYGRQLFAGHRVMPLISCRGYYRLHNLLLRAQLKRCQANLEPSLIVHHPVKEPWSTIGVFMKSAGFRPERSKWLSERYSHYGHTVSQLTSIKSYGQTVADSLMNDLPLTPFDARAPFEN